MADFLSRLLDRTQDRSPVLERRRPSLFEPALGMADLDAGSWAKSRFDDGEDVLIEPEAPKRPQRHGNNAINPRAPEVPDTRLPSSLLFDTSTGTADYRGVTEPQGPSIRPTLEAQRASDTNGIAATQAKPSMPTSDATIRTLHVIERTVERVASKPQVLTPLPNRENQDRQTPTLLSSSTITVKPALPVTIEVDPSIRATDHGAGSKSGETEKSPDKPSLVPPPRFSQPLRHFQPPRVREPIPPSPTVHVTIGRIEIRATPPQAQARPAARPALPKLSLEDYLRSRNGGKR